MSVAKLLELAQNKELLKQSCKENENTICPKDIYRFENRIVIDYGNYVVTIPIRKRPTYEQWAEKRDRKLLKMFRKLRQLEAEYNKQREIVKKLRQQFYRLKQEYKELRKQYELLKIPTLEKLLNVKETELMKMYGKYCTEQAKMRMIKSQIKAIKQKFERSRKVAKMQFESYKPMHSLPISAWKKRIKMVLEMLDSYFEKSDMLGLAITKKLNHKDIEAITGWHQFLNDLLYELTEDILIDSFEFGKEFKKPALVKLLQNHLYDFDWNSVMQTVMLWLKTKP